MPSACLFNKNTLNDALEICMLDDPYILHYDVWTFCIICFVKSDHPLLSDHHIRFYIFLTSQPLIDQTAILQKLSKNCIHCIYELLFLFVVLLLETKCFKHKTHHIYDAYNNLHKYYTIKHSYYKFCKQC